ncbi:unnamed protein product [Amoebophrya sp. A120]|nr:unnamed protein product [Amoebophrya sp. A120]|eukprot:GSA120T00019151001.1
MGAQVSQGLDAVLFQPPERGAEQPAGQPSATVPGRIGGEKNFVTIQTRLGGHITAYSWNIGARDTILFSHANAEDLSCCVDFIQRIARYLRVNVFAYDYEGYGTSTGKASESALYADIEAAYTYLREVVGVPWEHIILYGRSIGTGPTVHLAASAPVRGVILQAPMASIYRIVFDFRFTMWGDQFANIDKIARVASPVCIVHGIADEIVPVWHGVELWKKLQRPVEPLWVPNGDHNALDHEMLLRRVKLFLVELEHMGFSENQLKQALQETEEIERLKSDMDGTGDLMFTTTGGGETTSAMQPESAPSSRTSSSSRRSEGSREPRERSELILRIHGGRDSFSEVRANSPHNSSESSGRSIRVGTSVVARNRASVLAYLEQQEHAASMEEAALAAAELLEGPNNSRRGSRVVTRTEMQRVPLRP